MKHSLWAGAPTTCFCQVWWPGGIICQHNEWLVEIPVSAHLFRHPCLCCALRDWGSFIDRIPTRSHWRAHAGSKLTLETSSFRQ